MSMPPRRFQLGDWVVVCRSYGKELPQPLTVAQIVDVFDLERRVYDYVISPEGSNRQTSYTCDEWLAPRDIVIFELPDLSDLV